MTVNIECDSGILSPRHCCPEEGRCHITTPILTSFIATVYKSRYEKTRVQWRITDYQLIFIIFVSYASTYPQSWQWFSVILLGNKSGIELVRKKSFVFCCFVYKHDLAKLQGKGKYFGLNKITDYKINFFPCKRRVTARSLCILINSNDTI